MYKKLSFTFIFILILMCLFCIRSYASTDCSVYDESSGKYTIQFPTKVVEELGLPFSTVPYYSNSEDIYYFIHKNYSGNYFFYFSDVNFVEVSTSFSTYSFKRSTDNNLLKYFCYITSSSKWGVELTSNNYLLSMENLGEIIVSSDDIYNLDGELIVPKTVFVEEEEAPTYADNFVLSSAYNNEWIDSYLDLNQNPIDRNKKINRFTSRLL